MKKLKVYILVFISIVLSGCVPDNNITLPSNYYYEGSYIDIHSPDSEGWSVVTKNKDKIVFAKKGLKSGESYIANVIFFPFKKVENKEEFLSLIIKQASDTFNKDRFTLLKSSFKLKGRKTYPCVLVKELLEDRKAKVSVSKTETLLMDTKSTVLYRSKRENAAFMIGYSYRGHTINPDLDLEADSFINGVYFKEYK